MIEKDYEGKNVLRLTDDELMMIYVLVCNVGGLPDTVRKHADTIYHYIANNWPNPPMDVYEASNRFDELRIVVNDQRVSW